MARPDITMPKMQRSQKELACDNNYYGYVYITTNLLNGMKYIGQHSSNTFDKYYYGSGKLIKQALEDYGTENFECEVIEWCSSYEELNKREIYWINYYNADTSDNFYNIAYGGSNSKYALRGENHPFFNKKHKQESLIKMRESKLGNKNPMYGHHQSEETKQKISDAQLGDKNHMYGKHEEAYWFGKHRDEETKNKISETRIKNKIALGENNPFFGKTHSDETKLKISNVHKDTVYINNGEITKRIKKEDVDIYLSEGWVKGRILKRKENVVNELS